MLYNGIANVLELNEDNDWVTVRRELTDEKISKIYSRTSSCGRSRPICFSYCLPDGTARAVYTGSIHPNAIAEFALGASLYFGQLIIEHPLCTPEQSRRSTIQSKIPRPIAMNFSRRLLSPSSLNTSDDFRQ